MSSLSLQVLWVTALNDSSDSNNHPYHIDYCNNYNVQTEKSWRILKQISDAFP